jgi:hypothetical protein
MPGRRSGGLPSRHSTDTANDPITLPALTVAWSLSASRASSWSGWRRTSAFTPTPILSAVFPIASGAEIERSISAPSPPTVAGADERAATRRDAGARQLRLAAKTLQPAGGALARGLDALKALLAALADRDQLGLDLAAAPDRQANGVRGRASGRDSV